MCSTMAFKQLGMALLQILLFSTVAVYIADCEIVYPRIVNGRTSSGQITVEINGIDEKRILDLRPASIFAEECILRTIDNGIIIDQWIDVQQQHRSLYHDVTKMASLYIQEENVLKMTGMISENLRIEPLEEDSASHFNETNIPHRVTRMEVKETNLKSEGITNSPYYNDVVYTGQHNVTDSEKMKPRKPFEALRSDVEVVIFLDKTSTSMFDTEFSMLLYIGSVFCAVNLRMQSVVKTQIIIVGIISSKQELHSVSSQLHQDNQKYLWLNSIHLFAEEAEEKLSGMGYDCAILLTGKDLVATYNGAFSTAVIGAAFYKGVCMSGYRYAVVEDRPYTFDCIRTCAHEIGHLLGADHDGFGDSESCPFDDGYIMSYKNHDHNSYKFSSCSSKAMANFRRSESAACLGRTDSNTKFPTYQALPGHVFPNKDEYCKQLSPKVAQLEYIEFPERTAVCQVLCCTPMPSTPNTVSCTVHPALDGHSCGRNKECENGVCLEVTANHRIFN